MKIYDERGEERTPSWLTEHYGDLTITQPGKSPRFQVLELRERVHCDATEIVTVLNSAGLPYHRCPVVFSWPDAEHEPNSGWDEKGVIGITNRGGHVGFGMGTGAYYDPAKTPGPHKVWIHGPDTSPCVAGLGMIAGTQHNHIDVVFQEVDPEEPPEPPEPPTPGRTACRIHIPETEMLVTLETVT